MPIDPVEHVNLAWKEANRFHNVLDFETLAAEALLALIRGAAAFDESLGNKPASFLGPVIHNACLSEWRRQKKLRREVALYVVSAEGEEMERPDLPTVEPDAEHRVLAREVREAVERLPERERLIVERRYGLHDGDPVTGREVGEILGLSQQRAEQIRRQAERRLRKHMTSKRSESARLTG